MDTHKPARVRHEGIWTTPDNNMTGGARLGERHQIWKRYLFVTTFGAGLPTSSWALTFCRPAVSASICFCWRATVASCFAALDFTWAITASCSCTLLCALRN